MSYEVHITVTNNPMDWPEFEWLSETYGWKTSIIAGDPLLGPGDKFYFTCHDDDYTAAFTKMSTLSNLLNTETVRVLRQKIEMIVFDTKDMSITSN